MQHYQPLEMLAPALFGSVQKWRHTPSNECVAIKRIELHSAARKRSFSSERVVDEDILIEIKTNLRVQLLGGHPNVLPLRDCIMEGDAVLLVLKFCERGELLNVLNAQRAGGKQLNVRRSFSQIVRGAAFLHANGIAHRDLSLENILVDERDCCYITDFGLATHSSENIVVRPVGKVRYMAPEVCAALAYEDDHQEVYNPMAADVWALGVMLYAMVASRYPFLEPTREDNRFRLLEDFGVEYLLEKDEVDVTGKECLIAWLKKLLVVDPAERATLTELESEVALPAVQFCKTRRVSLVEDWREQPLELAAPEHKVDPRQHVRSLGRFTRKGPIVAARSSKSLPEAEKNRHMKTTLAFKAAVTALTPTPGNSGSDICCSNGAILRKCYATARA